MVEIYAKYKKRVILDHTKFHGLDGVFCSVYITVIIGV